MKLRQWAIGGLLLLVGILFEPIGWLQIPLGDGRMNLYPAGLFILLGLVYWYRSWKKASNNEPND